MTKARFILLAGLLVLVGLSGLAGCRSAHTTSAILYIDEQNYDKAVQVIHEGFQYRDDEPDAYYYLGEAYSHLAEEAVEDDDFPEAKKNYDWPTRPTRRPWNSIPKDFTEKVDHSLQYNYNNRVRQAKLDWDEDYYEQAEGHLRLAYAALPDSMTPIKNIARMKMQMSQDERLRATSEDDLLNEALVLLDQVLAKQSRSLRPAAEQGQRAGRPGPQRGSRRDLRHPAGRARRRHGPADRHRQPGHRRRRLRAGRRFLRQGRGPERSRHRRHQRRHNKDMLVAAGTWYSHRRTSGATTTPSRCWTGRPTWRSIPTENTMLMRLRTYYNYGKKLKNQAAAPRPIPRPRPSWTDEGQRPVQPCGGNRHGHDQ